ncbi:TssQ family T6SS-associated lipoprotein [Advenella mimigardefordensis]|uniref:Putative lipoprotein n=1 Tax=Advenella mimigardefordensis (strain DSM 17166 / LMG 22922 / DPN7) TaxID=1247726 RepID=W0PBF8_ADVMD|nr:TssQ family T6SS-associated lipoprotein [Advenella mimigardefordensis]AHG62750.1 putative lipoprotein [Advenella mimigardefordensis DPN7]
MNALRVFRLSGVLAAGVFMSACSLWGGSDSTALSSSEEIQIRPIRESFMAGQYDAVITQVNSTPALSSGSVPLHTTALKYKAFSECLTEAKRSCASTFEQILTLNPNFTLLPAEKSHPSWGPVFERVQAEHQPASGNTASSGAQTSGSITPIRPLTK